MPSERKPGKIGIIFAMREEKRGLERVLSGASLLAGNEEVMLVVGGVGGERAAAAAEKLIADGAQWIICAGFAAGLAPEIAAGDVLVASRVVREDREAAIECSPGLIGAAPPDGSFSFAVRRGALVTVDAVVCEVSEKARLRESTGASALDMESGAVGEACSIAGVAFLAVRSVTDTAEESLPRSIAALAEIDGMAGRIAFALRHPRLWGSALALRRRSIVAADNLGDVLAFILLRLV